MEPEGMSYSRLGPLDPRQVRFELAGELDGPSGSGDHQEPAADQSNRRVRKRPRRLRRSGGRG